MSIYTAALDAVARHLPFAVVLVAGAILRTFVVFAYQPVLMLQRDTYAYLEMAAGKGRWASGPPSIRYCSSLQWPWGT